MRLSRLSGLAVALAVLATGASANAQTWRQTHPRRVEVNSRLGTQNARITQGVRDGQLSHGQAQALRSDDRAIRGEERADAAVNGGHVTRGEQAQLNRQENANSAAIFNARH